MKEFLIRTASAAVLIVIVYSAVRFLPDLFFFSFIFLLAALASLELGALLAAPRWQQIWTIPAGALIGLSLWRGQPNLAQLVFVCLLLGGVSMVFWVRKPERLPQFPQVFAQQFLVLLYVFFPLFHLFLLRGLGNGWLFFLIWSVAIGDSGAYFVGKAVGKHKIYPVASPKKSLEGFIAALVSAALFAIPGYYLFSLTRFSLAVVMACGFLLALLSQLADPLESLFKRFAGVKDSGRIIPGHGGVLDRIDSYLLCAPAFYYLLQWIS